MKKQKHAGGDDSVAAETRVLVTTRYLQGRELGMAFDGFLLRRAIEAAKVGNIALMSNGAFPSLEGAIIFAIP